MLYNIYSRGSPLHLLISLGVLGLKNIEDPWSKGLTFVSKFLKKVKNYY